MINAFLSQYKKSVRISAILCISFVASCTIDQGVPEGYLKFIVEVSDSHGTQKLESALMRAPGDAFPGCLLRIRNSYIQSLVIYEIWRKDEGDDFVKNCESHIKKALSRNGVLKYQLKLVRGTQPN